MRSSLTRKLANKSQAWLVEPAVPVDGWADNGDGDSDGDCAACCSAGRPNAAAKVFERSILNFAAARTAAECAISRADCSPSGSGSLRALELSCWSLFCSDELCWQARKLCNCTVWPSDSNAPEVVSELTWLAPDRAKLAFGAASVRPWFRPSVGPALLAA